jgi:hypothetical protein
MLERRELLARYPKLTFAINAKMVTTKSDHLKKQDMSANK